MSGGAYDRIGMEDEYDPIEERKRMLALPEGHPDRVKAEAVVERIMRELGKGADGWYGPPDAA
jgi:hypothetical protein